MKEFGNMTVEKLTDSEQRIDWVDYAKTLAIFFVVWLHVHSDPAVTKYINAFIMPMFFLISGYLFSYRRNMEFGKFAMKRTRQIIVPYLWINVLAYLFWLTLTRNYGADASDPVAWHIPLIGIVVGIPPFLEHDVPLWSLVSFFVCEMLYYPLGRCVKNPLVIAVSALLFPFVAVVLFPDTVGFLPLAFIPSVAGMGFYAVGQYVSGKVSPSVLAGFMSTPLFLLLSLVVFIPAVWLNTDIKFYICRYGCYPLFLLSSFAGSAFSIGIAMLAARRFGKRSFFTFVSSCTLMICGFHVPMFSVMKGVAWFGAGVAPETLYVGLIPGFLFAVTTFLLTLPLSWVIRRYLRFLVDK